MRNLLILILFLSSNVFACSLSNESLNAPVWYNGQTKSFQLASFFTIKKLFKKTSLKKASEFYCILLKGDEKEIASHELYQKSENKYLELKDRLPKIFNDANKIEDEAKRDLALARYEKTKTFREILHRKHIMYKGKTWLPLISIANFSDATLEKALLESAQNIEDNNYLYENFIYKYKLLSLSFYLLIFAFIIRFIPFKQSALVSNSFIMGSFLAQVLIVLLRVLYTQRAPIANMYETVLLAAPFALLLGVFAYRKNKILFDFSALFALGAIGTLYFSGHMLDSEIKNIMPVLRDNFWLSTHVTSIVFSYSVLGVTWMIANYGMIRLSFGKSVEEKNLNDAIFLALKYGVFFLFLGILLGAIWADYSWGRFWAWDPKETWSLIAFLVYMILLHAIRGKLIPQKFLYVYVGLSFLSILIAWFGVNFVMSSGLHSYGFSVGGSLFLASLIFGQLLIVFFYSYRLTGSTR